LDHQKSIIIENWKSPFGELVLGVHADKICLCDWRYRAKRAAIDQRLTSFIQCTYIEGTHPLIESLKTQLNEYFLRKRTKFELPIELIGSAFQQKVWEKLQQIPYGKTITYIDLAIELNNVKAIRAVAAANGANAISIIVPCHRVIGKNGEPVGYAGGLATKKQLLALESPIKQTSLFEV